MLYHAPTKQFTVPVDQLEAFAANMRFAIKTIRQMGGKALEGGDSTVAMTKACHAEQAILDAARLIGVDLGAARSGHLDVREAE
ncbi:hypothetical protein [Pseudomonas guariconensis]|uniref:hypothetical protein n=1 Tax=Pseudomonas guariconensis TaxID=1288410 RepID=UPI003905B954